MPRNKTAVSDLGSIDAHGTEFRAHIQCRGNAGEQKHIRGPSRGSQHEAQRDLDQLRKAGSIGTTREEGLKLMEAEANLKGASQRPSRRIFSPTTRVPKRAFNIDKTHFLQHY